VNPAALFVTATAIWGTTWLAITYQLGHVAPEVSVVYRFALAGALLGAWCVVTGKSLRFDAREHGWIALQGSLLFGFNYVTIYWAEQHVASGLVAVLFSTIVFMSIVGTRTAFATPITARALLGAAAGVVGVALLFLPELAAARNGGEAALGIVYGLLGTLIATLGNLAAMRTQRMGIAILPGTAWGMIYGAISAALIATATGVEWTFDPRAPYLVSLAYLAVFGSIAAFGAYLTLLKQVGAGPSSYVGVMTPVVALGLSTAFEGYRWTWIAVLGVVLAVAGNVLVMRGRGVRRP